MVVCYTLANTWNLVWSVWPWLYVIPLRTRGIWCGVCGHGCMLYPCKHVEFSVEYMAMVVCYTLANTWNLVWSVWPWLYVIPL